jgi:hypothetical protein
LAISGVPGKERHRFKIRLNLLYAVVPFFLRIRPRLTVFLVLSFYLRRTSLWPVLSLFQAMSSHGRALLPWPWSCHPCSPASRVPSPCCAARAALQPYVLHGCASPAPPRVGPRPPPCLVPRVGPRRALAGRPAELPWPWSEPRPFLVRGAAATCGDGGHDICTERKVEDEVITMLPPTVI